MMPGSNTSSWVKVESLALLSEEDLKLLEAGRALGKELVPFALNA